MRERKERRLESFMLGFCGMCFADSALPRVMGEKSDDLERVGGLYRHKRKHLTLKSICKIPLTRVCCICVSVSFRVYVKLPIQDRKMHDELKAYKN